jgi:hypothetical protein
VKLTRIAIFGIGYVLGTRAGRERYQQIVTAAQNASERLENYFESGNHPKDRSPGTGETSDGLLIETSVLARLFGFKLLTLEGTVVVTPAQLRELSHGHPMATDVTAFSRAYEASAAARRMQGLTTTAVESEERVGIRLAEAVRLLHESAGDLDRLDQD